MDEESGLEALVAQRKSRPAFARMISWEIGKRGSASGKRARKTTDASTEDEILSVSEDEQRGENSEVNSDLEYYSAGEYVSSLTDDFDDFQLNYTSADHQLNVTEDRCTCITSSTTGNTDSAFPSLDISSHQPDKSHGLSKKSKKRRRRKLKSILFSAHAEYDIPFRDVEDIDIEVSDCVGFADNMPLSTLNVPTLFELCVKAVSVRGHYKYGQPNWEPPKVMKNVLWNSCWDQPFKSVQLSWLYQLIGYAENDLFGKEGDSWVQYLAEGDSKESKEVKFYSRSIWDICNHDDGLENDIQYGSPLSCILLYSYVYCNFQNRYATRWKLPFFLTSILASLMDLMFPQQIPLERLGRASLDTNTESEAIHKALCSSLSSIKQALKKRYPRVAKYFFDEAVPYMFWARGNLTCAAEGFVRLAKTKEGIDRAKHLGEAARLYAQYEETEKASSLYREASGAVIDIAKKRGEGHDVRLQQFMLIASVYDQGVMTPEKAHQAVDAWAFVMKCYDPKSPWITAMRAVESFLCFHSGFTQESARNRLLEAKSLIKSNCDKCDILYLYLSLVNALLGETRQSQQALTDFSLSMNADLVKLSEIASGNSNTQMPWTPLVDHFEEHGTPDLLKVLWRTQLGHPRLVYDKEFFEADIVAKTDLKLRLTETGYLTADLQMLLPPIRALCLDPYTGLHVPTSGQTQEWHSFHEQTYYSARNLNNYFLTPTPVELYRDEQGNCIHLWSYDVFLTNNPYNVEQATLLWTGANGEKAKLNLMPYLKDVVRQGTLHYIHLKAKNYETEIKKNPNNTEWIGSPDCVKTWTQSVEYCHKRGYAYNTFFIGGTSKADFLDPVVTMDSAYNGSVPYEDHQISRIRLAQMSARNTPIAQDEVMWLKGSSNEVNLHEVLYRVYGRKGQVLKTIWNYDNMETPYVMGRKLYGISQDKLRVLCDDLTNSIFVSEELSAINTLLLGGGKIIPLTDNAIYFLDPDTLSVLSITKYPKSSNVELSENSCSIKCPQGSEVKILEEKRLEGKGRDKIRLAVSINMTLMFVDVADDVEIVLDLLVAGLPKEVCTVSTNAGFLVSASIHADETRFYRENLYYYRHDGRFQGVLPLLGPGPRCFCVEYLKGSGEATESGLGDHGWYIFMRDGHEGIICVRLPHLS